MDEIEIDPAVYENYYSYSYTYPQHWFYQNPDETNNTAVYNPYERLDVTPAIMQTPPSSRKRQGTISPTTTSPTTSTSTMVAMKNARHSGLLSARTKLSPPVRTSQLFGQQQPSVSSSQSGYGYGSSSPASSTMTMAPGGHLGGVGGGGYEGQFSPVREDALMLDNHFIDIPDRSLDEQERIAQNDNNNNNNFGYSASSLYSSVANSSSNSISSSHNSAPVKSGVVDPRLSMRRELVQPVVVGDDQSPALARSNMGTSMSNTMVSPTNSEAPAQTGWPEELKDLIASILNRVTDKKRVGKVNSIIRRFVQEKHDNNEVWTTDWTNIVIPGLEEFTKKRKRKFEVGPHGDDFDVSVVRGRVHAEKASKGSKSSSSSSSAAIVSVNLKGIGGGDSMASLGMRKLPPLRVSFPENTVSSPAVQKSNVSIIGSNMTLEKRYLRLTSAPKLDTVRPEHVLKDTIGFLKNKWQQKKDYIYICDQLKSVRQDLTVQMIRNEFTVKVYELHARLALENNDLGEFNQCQSQLANLYREGIAGHEEEFTAYRILYFVHTKNKTALNALMRDLTPKMRTQKAIRHALHVRRAAATGNYSLLFKLHAATPNMGAYLIDQFMDRSRVDSLKIITKAYRPNVEVEFVGRELAFESPEKWNEFMAQHLPEGQDESVVYFTGDDGLLDRLLIDCKSAYMVFAEAAKKYSKVDIKGQL